MASPAAPPSTVPLSEVAELPPEVLARIAWLCTGPSRQSLRATCRELRSAAHPSRIQIVHPGLLFSSQDMKLSDKLAAQAKGATTTDALVVVPFVSDGSNPSAKRYSELELLAFLKDAADRLGAWRHLRCVVAPLSSAIVSSLTAHCPGLECLELSNRYFGDRLSPQDGDPSHHLELHACQSMHQLAACQTLRHLKVQIRMLTLPARQLPLASFTQLHSLALDVCVGLDSAEAFSESLSHLTQLTKLSLDVTFADMFPPWQLGPLPRLQHLSVSLNYGSRFPTLVNLPSLTHLDAMGSLQKPQHGITLESLLSTAHAYNLQDLVLLGVILRQRHMAALAPACQHLTRLRAQGIELSPPRGRPAAQGGSTASCSLNHPPMGPGSLRHASSVVLPCLRELHVESLSCMGELRAMLPAVESLQVCTMGELPNHPDFLAHHPSLRTLAMPCYWLQRCHSDEPQRMCNPASLQYISSLTTLKLELVLIRSSELSLACPRLEGVKELYLLGPSLPPGYHHSSSGPCEVSSLIKPLLHAVPRLQRLHLWHSEPQYWTSESESCWPGPGSYNRELSHVAMAVADQAAALKLLHTVELDFACVDEHIQAPARAKRAETRRAAAPHGLGGFGFWAGFRPAAGSGHVAGSGSGVGSGSGPGCGSGAGCRQVGLLTCFLNKLEAGARHVGLVRVCLKLRAEEPPSAEGEQATFAARCAALRRARVQVDAAQQAAPLPFVVQMDDVVAASVGVW